MEISVKDTINRGFSVTLDADDFEEVIGEWFPVAPEEFTAAIARLGHLVRAEQWSPEVLDLENYLGLEVSR